MSNLPLVSISCITFNHVNFLRECFEGFLKQQTNFSFEILVHDDASTDGTKAIIEEYTKNYPTIFFPIYQSENQFSQGVRGIMARFNFSRSRGKYIALCEGDDYWTDPYKLQKQVDFLEANEEYVLTFHPVKILKPDGILVDDFITKVPDNYELQETLARFGNYIHTPSVLYRNVLKSFPKEISLSPIGDFFIYMLLTEHGKIKMLEDTMGVYRFGVGVHSVLSLHKKSKDWNLTLTLLISSMQNFEIKKILLERLFPQESVFPDISKKTNQNFYDNKFKRFVKLFLPPIFIVITNKLFK